MQDCEDPNPLIRALAVRTMGCIRVDKITEYLCEPLRKCLKDEDPYVRKTAAVCVAKLHDINAQMVEDQGFLDSLRDLIADSNPMVTFPSTLLMFVLFDNQNRKRFFTGMILLVRKQLLPQKTGNIFFCLICLGFCLS